MTPGSSSALSQPGMGSQMNCALDIDTNTIALSLHLVDLPVFLRTGLSSARDGAVIRSTLVLTDSNSTYMN